MVIKKHNFALFVLFSWSCIDFFASIFRELLSYSAAIKLAFFVPLLLISFATVFTKHRFIIVALFGISVALVLVYPDSFNSNYSSRLFGFIIVFLVFYYSLQNVEIKKLMKLIFSIVGISFVALIISAIGGENSVYDAEGFGGGSGGFYSANQYSYFLIVMISIVLIFIGMGRENQNPISYTFLFLSIVNCFILTTKSSLAFAFLALLLFAMVRKSWFLVGLVFASTLLALVRFYDELSVINRFLFFMDKTDLLWALTSGRSERIEDFYSIYLNIIPEENKVINFEMELFDSIANLGVAGMFFVLGFMGYAIRKSSFSALALTIVFVVILIILLSGHFFNAIAIAPFLAVFFLILHRLRTRTKFYTVQSSFASR